MPTSQTSQAGLAERARHAIRNSGLAQREIARQIGVDETKLSKSRKGIRRLPAQEIVLLATVTGVTANWLITGSDSADGPTVAPPRRILPKKHREDQNHAQRRRSIVEKAWWLFAQRGYASVRIADIAGEIGVSTATVHYYFPTNSPRSRRSSPKRSTTRSSWPTTASPRNCRPSPARWRGSSD